MDELRGQFNGFTFYFPPIDGYHFYPIGFYGFTAGVFLEIVERDAALRGD